MSLQTLDWAGYHAHRDLVDFWLLNLSDGGPDATPAQLMAKLREIGVGDANRMTASRSPTPPPVRSTAQP